MNFDGHIIQKRLLLLIAGSDELSCEEFNAQAGKALLTSHMHISSF